MTTDPDFMRLALDAARRGLGQTSPNPAVGAVIVRDSAVLATGFHASAGGPHAEIQAIRALENPDTARGATLYVTLEPCSTHGRTPPCTEAIQRAGFGRVVVGATDPNPRHAGRGLDILRTAGIVVDAGVLADECTDMNRAFNRWITTGMPWVIAKTGMTLDGRLTRGPGHSPWITSEESRLHAQRTFRAAVDAILVGGETVRADTPRLTVRGVPDARQPWRVVWTKSGDLPTDAHLFTDPHRGRTLVFRDVPITDVLRDLGRRGVLTVLAEGGGGLHGVLFDAGLVDEIAFYIAPVLGGGPVPAIAGVGCSTPQEAVRLTGVAMERIGPDILFRGRVESLVLEKPLASRYSANNL